MNFFFARQSLLVAVPLHNWMHVKFNFNALLFPKKQAAIHEFTQNAVEFFFTAKIVEDGNCIVIHRISECGNPADQTLFFLIQRIVSEF